MNRSQQVDLLYGRGVPTVPFPVEADLTVIGKPAFPEVGSAANVLNSALSNPVGSASLDALCAGCQSACILIRNITLPVPNHVFLQPMIRIMMANGIAAEDITVLIATGLHRPNEGDELAELVRDPWVLDTGHCGESLCAA